MENGNLETIKHELSVLARRKKARSTDWSPDCPIVWKPSSVIDPKSGFPFTPEGAWDFIAEQLESNDCRFEEIVLDRPKGKKAYVIRVNTQEGEIYIKIQFGNGGKIKGRSFHYS